MANSNGWGDGSVNNSIGWGQGANNTIGWGKSQLTSWSGATDIDGGNLPSNSVAPAITGTAQEGQTLTCSTGTWSGSPTYTYQWKRNGNNITSATNSTYVLVTADVGQTILCTVTATNFIGSASANSNSVTPTSSTDADAQAFITAASITDPTQQSAINQLVVDLKGYNIWTKMKALYPFVGGTASAHKFNLKDPRDLDAAFRLVFSGGITHSSSGVDPNGVNGTADTKMTSASLGTSSLSMWYYSREDIVSNALMGNANKLIFVPKLASNNTSYYALNCDVQLASTAGWAPSNYTGLLGLNRTGTSDFKAWRNGASYKTLATVTGAGTEAGNVTLFQRNVVGQYTANQCALAALGDGLTNTDASNFYTAVQAFQTTLGRQV